MIQARLEQARSSDRRSSPRLKLALGASLHGTGETVLIHDFSSTGMLIETAARLRLFDKLEIDLPEVGSTRAVVVWTSGRYYGCEFRKPLSKAAISAALLRSQPTSSPHTSEQRPFVVVQRAVPETSVVQDGPASAAEDEKAPFGVRLRVILGSTIVLWAIIIWTVRALIGLIP